jgi:hypothetical protein
LIDHYNSEFVGEASYLVGSVYQMEHENYDMAKKYFIRALDVSLCTLAITPSGGTLGDVTDRPVAALPEGSLAKRKTLVSRSALAAGLAHWRTQDSKSARESWHHGSALNHALCLAHEGAALLLNGEQSGKDLIEKGRKIDPECILSLPQDLKKALEAMKCSRPKRTTKRKRKHVKPSPLWPVAAAIGISAITALIWYRSTRK